MKNLIGKLSVSSRGMILISKRFKRSEWKWFTACFLYIWYWFIESLKRLVDMAFINFDLLIWLTSFSHYILYVLSSKNKTISKHFESILWSLRMSFSELVIHFIIIALMLIRFIQCLSNFCDLNHSFLKPFASLQTRMLHLLQNFSRHHSNQIFIFYFKTSDKRFCKNWERKVSIS